MASRRGLAYIAGVDIVFRRAVADDVPALREVLSDEPSDEQLGMAGGNHQRATRFRRVASSSMTADAALARTTVAVIDGRVVGLLQSGAEAGDAITLRIAWEVLRAFGPGVFAFLRRYRTRGRVHIRPPAGAYHIAEIHVLASGRGKGVGGALLDEAEREARDIGAHQMSLTTTTSNPARRLYERHGFRVVETREDPEFQAITGISGRILMVKDLA